LRGDLGVHDPSIIASEGQYFLFFTGRGVQTKHSSDLSNWQRTNPVFAQNPAWIAQQVPGATDLWAPDISYFGGAFHLYYSASTFGSNHSCIGHATRASLTTGAWQDRGAVICSNANGANDDWNAIDPNAALDENGTPWLTFGSFWSGIKQIKLTMEGARADDTLNAVAGRNGGAIEAPFVVRHCGEYFLFVSFDACCKGADSTYRIMVGRSRAIGGPYVDRAGMQLTRGGGSELLKGNTVWRGPGHNAVLLGPSGDYNVYHSYAASDGHSELRISELSWDDAGWPLSAGP
jgi:arabinan endo-1,5-alpha-L-arabinosidase